MSNRRFQVVRGVCRSFCPEVSDDRGFSLVEVLVALAILGFIALGIAGLLNHAVLQNASGFDYARLANLARVALEDLQATPFDDATLTAAGSPHVYPSPDQRFSITYTVTDYGILAWNEVTGVPPEAWPTPDATGGSARVNNLKRVTVRVQIIDQGPLLGRRQFVATGLVIPG